MQVTVQYAMFDTFSVETPADAIRAFAPLLHVPFAKLECLEVTVPDSWQLRWWVLSLGEMIEVLEPAALRNEVVERLGQNKQGMALYQCLII